MTEQDLVLVTKRRIGLDYLRAFACDWLFDRIVRNNVSSWAATGEASLPWPKDRGRRSAMNYAKVGQVMFGPEVPGGSGELVVMITRKKGKKLRLEVLRDGRPAGSSASMVGHSADWHADDTHVLFGMPKRGEQKRVIEPLLEAAGLLPTIDELDELLPLFSGEGR